jgi:hypothetical protein
MSAPLGFGLDQIRAMPSGITRVMGKQLQRLTSFAFPDDEVSSSGARGSFSFASGSRCMGDGSGCPFCVNSEVFRNPTAPPPPHLSPSPLLTLPLPLFFSSNVGKEVFLRIEIATSGEVRAASILTYTLAILALVSTLILTLLKFEQVGPAATCLPWLCPLCAHAHAAAHPHVTTSAGLASSPIQLPHTMRLLIKSEL